MDEVTEKMDACEVEETAMRLAAVFLRRKGCMGLREHDADDGIALEALDGDVRALIVVRWEASVDALALPSLDVDASELDRWRAAALRAAADDVEAIGARVDLLSIAVTGMERGNIRWMSGLIYWRDVRFPLE